MIQGRAREALAQYMQELTLLEQILHPDEAEVGSAYRHVGVAHFILGEITAADQYLAHAVAIMEAAIVNLPSEKAGYQSRLKEILLEQARAKRSFGAEADAVALERKAEALPDGR